jgi:hypothetical protein
VIGGVAATSSPTLAGNGCARYLRQQTRDREDARLRPGPPEKPAGHTDIARRAFQEERHPAIDPFSSVAFHPSGDAPGGAFSLAATPLS